MWICNCEPNLPETRVLAFVEANVVEKLGVFALYSYSYLMIRFLVQPKPTRHLHGMGDWSEYRAISNETAGENI